MLLRRNTRKGFFLCSVALLLSDLVRADGPPAPSPTNNPFAVIMIIIIVILAVAIILLANVLLGTAQMVSDDDRKDKAGDPKILSGLAAVQTVNGLSDTAFYLLTGVVFLEVAIVLTLLYNVKLLLAVYKKKQGVGQESAEEVVGGAGIAGAVVAAPRISWWERINRLKPLAQEYDLDLGHDYDGIRELDNRLPPWWLYGFYGTILFAGIYLWRYHVVHSAPLSGEEYNIAMQQAEVQKAAYLKKAANNIDENTVKLLTDPSDLAAGKAVFESTCFACHGKSGEGGVGPNLTDEYWLHGGSINEVFKTIKYGWPEKGMKSWKDDYSPSQIAEIASYVKSLGGTHPANPKPPQGVLDK